MKILNLVLTVSFLVGPMAQAASTYQDAMNSGSETKITGVALENGKVIIRTEQLTSDARGAKDAVEIQPDALKGANLTAMQLIKIVKAKQDVKVVCTFARVPYYCYGLRLEF